MWDVLDLLYKIIVFITGIASVAVFIKRRNA